MNARELGELIRTEESETLEHKVSLSDLKRIVEVVCSFANKKGGALLIGVTGDRKLVGVDVGRQTIEQLTNTIVDNTDPRIYPEVQVHEIGGKNVIVIRVKESTNRPHLTYGKAFIRVGKNTKLMSRSEYEGLLLKRKPQQFDSEICKDATLKDIGEEKVKLFLRKAKTERNLDIDPKIPLREALDKLKVIKGGQLTNTAVLMFARKPQDFLLQDEVKCARFKGTNTKEFIDMAEFSGSIYEQVDNAEKFVLKNIKKAAWIEPGKIERQEKWEYPPGAVREAITNAIVHRDYRTTSKVQVRIFDDRIEIWNPGSLPEGWTVENLKKKHESRPFNPLLARMFFLIRYIEEWGRGTIDMIRECLDHGLPEPDFEDTGSSIIVTFRKSKLTEEHLEGLDLNERQREAIEYLKEKKKITSTEYARIFQITGRMARSDLRKLVDTKILARRGVSKKTTYYVLTEI